MAENVTNVAQDEAQDVVTQPDETAIPDSEAASATVTEEVPTEESAAAEKPAESEDAAAWRERYARLMADFDNYRKRQMRDRDEIVKRANGALIDELLPVVDNLELAISAAPAPDDPFVAGVRIVAEQFVSALAKAGAVPIDASGQPFSYEHHEALGQIPSDTIPAGHVALQLRKGWLLADRLLRPAQVMVSSGPAAAAAAETTNEAETAET